MCYYDIRYVYGECLILEAYVTFYTMRQNGLMEFCIYKGAIDIKKWTWIFEELMLFF